MKFREELEDAIAKEAKKLALRHHAYHNALELEQQRKSRRVVSPSAKQLLTPAEWKVDRKYDPFYVHKNRKSIARSIARKILDLSYSPLPPFEKTVQKDGGGERRISVYQIPDAAVSSLFYRKLLQKNRHRFSASSYAYRDDRNAHFAIQDISVDLEEVSRVFIAEYDFSKFFDSIDHDYLFAQFSRNGFSISTREEHVVRAFLSRLTRGIPQGTSVSLFLANLVCWRLDRDLERAGLKFARYADDTVVWSADYGKITRGAELIAAFSQSAGVPLNTDKSKGIRLLCREGMPSEFASATCSFEFLGYSISVDKIAIKATSVAKIKRQISFILYKDLIQPLIGSVLRAVSIPANDRDTSVEAALASIRRFLYGNLSEEFIRRYLAGSSSRLFYKGLMSYYPLLSDKSQMQELDGWLANEVMKAIRLRNRLLKRWKFDRSKSFPFNVPRLNFVERMRAEKRGKRRPYALPSFVVVYFALRKAVSQEGVQQMLGREEYS